MDYETAKKVSTEDNKALLTQLESVPSEALLDEQGAGHIAPNLTLKLDPKFELAIILD